MRTLLTSLLLTFLAFPAFALERPNVILILADDFGYECVGANGGSSYQTPNLDKLATQGMRFENCYVQPSCTPTRLQLMTGMYNIRNYTIFGEMAPSQKTFANYFKEAGYTTGIFGKWQLGREKSIPRHFGFDEFVLWWHTRRAPRYANPGLDFNGVPVDYTNGEYGPAIVHDNIIRFIEENKAKPFFAYYSMTLTHDPFQPTPDSADWDPKRRGEEYSNTLHFAEMTKYLDDCVGKVIKKLEETGLREKTLIIFLGDNGTSPEVTSILNGKPYQGGKGSTTVAGMHVPLIVSYPGTIKSGTVNSDLVDSTDFLPTLCDFASIRLPEDGTIDGISFYPQLLGQQGTPREWIYCWFLGQMQEGKQKICVQDKQYKLYSTGTFFDIVDDQREKRPIVPKSFSAEQKQAAERLQNVLDSYSDKRPQSLTLQ